MSVKTNRKTEDTTKLAQGLPKFGELLKTQRAQLRNLGGSANVYLEWDFSDNSKRHQVVRIITEKKGVRHESAVSVQELHHYLRAV